MLCSYRYYARADRRAAALPGRILPPKVEGNASPPPAPEPNEPLLDEAAPHAAIVRQYAW